MTRRESRSDLTLNRPTGLPTWGRGVGVESRERRWEGGVCFFGDGSWVGKKGVHAHGLGGRRRPCVWCYCRATYPTLASHHLFASAVAHDRAHVLVGPGHIMEELGVLNGVLLHSESALGVEMEVWEEGSDDRGGCRCVCRIRTSVVLCMRSRTDSAWNTVLRSSCSYGPAVNHVYLSFTSMCLSVLLKRCPLQTEDHHQPWLCLVDVEGSGWKKGAITEMFTAMETSKPLSSG